MAGMEPMTKGQNFLGMLRRFEIVKGAEATARLHQALDPVVQQALATRKIMPGAMIPLDWYKSLHRASMKAAGAGPEMIRELACAQTKDDLSGVYKIFLLVLSPQAVIKKANAILASYYNVGRLQVEDERKGYARGHFHGFTGFDRCLWEDMLGSAVGTLEAAGARNVTTTRRDGGGDGDEKCTVEFHWE